MTGVADDFAVLREQLKKIYATEQGASLAALYGSNALHAGGPQGPAGPTGPKGPPGNCYGVDFKSLTGQPMKLWISDQRSFVVVDGPAGPSVAISKAELLPLLKALNEAFILDSLADL